MFSRRLFFEAFVGFVFFLGGLNVSASLRSSTNRSVALFLFAACVLCFWEITLSMPSLLMRVLSFVVIAFFLKPVRDGEFIRSKYNVTRVLTLLTF